MGERVWIRPEVVRATVLSEGQRARYYIVETDQGTVLQRNRRHLSGFSQGNRTDPEGSTDTTQVTSSADSTTDIPGAASTRVPEAVGGSEDGSVVRTRSGRRVVPQGLRRAIKTLNVATLNSGITRPSELSGTMNVKEVRSGNAPTDSDNKSSVTGETLERLTPSATPQPMSAGTPGGIAAVQVMPDLSNNITSFNDRKVPFDRTGERLAAFKEIRNEKLERFKERFRRSFVSQTRAAERWRKMHERVQQRNESSVAYLHAKMRLCREANLDFWDTREQVITGLRSKQLSVMFLGKSHDDDDDILYDIQAFERIEPRCMQENPSSREVPRAGDPL
ncbi:hypothetical protein HPB49_014978 [Dermacentor silvarum]|uniref:Uncharacterized protein n=1 Tax=Dermacentor silvarum TaxID=543639 RepID=A0ACB8DE01_DERSI|nr:hypothetical protein HPB49_014978 [Dermacentor silvarum]